jgi:hypothetical protein
MGAFYIDATVRSNRVSALIVAAVRGFQVWEPVHAQAVKEKTDMKRRLDLSELRSQSGGRGAQLTPSGFSTWVVVAIVILAFLIGKYLGTGMFPVKSDAVIAEIKTV